MECWGCSLTLAHPVILAGDTACWALRQAQGKPTRPTFLPSPLRLIFLRASALNSTFVSLRAFRGSFRLRRSALHLGADVIRSTEL